MRMLAGLLIATSLLGCRGQAPNPIPAARPVAAATRATPAPRDAIARIDATTAGVVALTPSQVAPIDTLHVRLTIAPVGDDPTWTLDLRSAVVEMASGGEGTVVIANADIDTLPYVRIDPGERRLLDLYFTLPPGVVTELGPFEVRVAFGSPYRAFVWHADLDALAPTSDATLGRGARWWLDPTYRWPLFHRRDGVIAARTPTSVAITQPTPR